jgi:hypothetical protein
MRKAVRVSFLLLISLSLLPPLAVAACSSSCSTGTYTSKNGNLAQYVVCMPQPASCYNGSVVLFAHGYVPAGAPPGTWQNQLALPDGSTLPSLVNNLGFGFAASGFTKDGLAIKEGIDDTKALLDHYRNGLNHPVSRAYIAGASEGGLIAAKSIESLGGTYDAALAVCGPIGGFRNQINYFGDVRVLFDYFFPGVLNEGGDAMHIPDALMAKWSTVYEPKVRQAVKSDFWATLQLVSTSKLQMGLNFNNAPDAVAEALWYNIFATNDARQTLGGIPFDNIGRNYSGSFNDAKLNATVKRFAADSAAITNMQAYETTGLLGYPLVTLHTTADPVVPFWHETLYSNKAQATHSTSKLAQVPAFRYGHCNVNSTEVTTSFVIMLLMSL